MKLKFFVVLVLIILAVATPFAYRYLDYNYGNCLNCDVKLKVYPNDNVDSLVVRLADAIDGEKFKSYYDSFFESTIKEGYYELKSGISERNLLRVLANRYQTPVRVTFNNVTDFESLAGKVSKYFMADSVEFLTYLQDPQVWEKYSLKKETFPVLFIPNTYEMYWTDKPEKFVSRMATEYDRFWTEERKEKARTLGFTPIQISILASIVDRETSYAPDRTKIAGVYINRLRAGMPLQACPTVIFALGRKDIKRVLNKHLKYDSPYNTYMYKGLPPGPISMPDGNEIDAVLAYKGHKYFYFCASSDLSGKSEFAENFSQHSKFAKAYQRKMDQLKIK